LHFLDTSRAFDSRGDRGIGGSEAGDAARIVAVVEEVGRSSGGSNLVCFLVGWVAARALEQNRGFDITERQISGVHV
jgi:hypothetical protein